MSAKPYTLIYGGKLVGYYSSCGAAVADARDRNARAILPTTHATPQSWKVYHEPMAGAARVVEEGFL